jgi:poly(A) polymerase
LAEFVAYQDAANEVIAKQIKSTSLPRHITLAMREVWGLQPKFNICYGLRPGRLITHPRFRAAYDFLLLRAETGGADPALAEWWTRYQLADEAEQIKMTQLPRKRSNNKSGRKRSYRKKDSDKST